MTTNLIEARGLSVRYGQKTAVNEIAFSVREGRGGVVAQRGTINIAGPFPVRQTFPCAAGKLKYEQRGQTIPAAEAGYKN